MASYNYVITDQLIGAQPIETVSTVQNHPLGKIVRAKDPTYGEAEFIYLKGVTSGAAGKWITYDLDAGVAVLLTANAIGPVGILMSDIDAATDYGWAMISGWHPAAKCLTGFADNGIVFCTSTAGSVDDASVSGDLVMNAKGGSTTVANSFVAQFELYRPFVNDRTANK